MNSCRYIPLICFVVFFFATIAFYDDKIEYLPSINMKYQNVLIDQDLEKLPACTADDRSRQRNLYRTLQEWTRFAQQYKIQYWIAYETLVGYFQRRSILPYITYLDVFIMAHDTTQLAELCSLNFSSTYGLKVHPQWHIAEQSKRSYFESEGIDFVGPNARFINLKDKLHVNIWPMYSYHPNHTRILNISKPMLTTYDKNGIWKSFPKEWIFPLQQYIFSGIKVYGPTEPERLVFGIYDDNFLIRLPTKCVNGSWLGLEEILFKTTTTALITNSSTIEQTTDEPSIMTTLSDEDIIEKALENIPVCEPNDRYRQKRLLTILQAWVHLAEQHSIEYWITYGTLVGYIQRGGLLPHDPDVDILIMYHNTQKLVELSESNFSSIYEIKVQPQWKNFDYADRSYFRDQGINFVAPNARFIHRETHYHVDIFPAYAFNPLHANQSTEQAQSESIAIYDLYYKWILHPRNWTYPLKTCYFNDIKVWCPAEHEKLVENLYGSSALNKSDTECVSGSWVKAK